MGTNHKGTRILIADDDISVRKILSLRLTAEGYDCVTASDGDGALEKLSDSQFALALLDITMPGKSGVDVLKEIQAKYPDMVAIMVTAVADIEIAINSLRIGAYDYIIKPFDFNVLVISIDRALEKRRLVLENKSYQLHLEEKIKEQSERIHKSFYNAISSLAYALEAKDKYTSGHSQRVAKIAVSIAHELDMPDDDVEKIRFAGLVHDIGKIGIRESVLNKQGKLTKEEYSQIMSHCEIGERILCPIVEDKEILDMVRHHHEHYDGTGYPDGLSAGETPHTASILETMEVYIYSHGNPKRQDTLSLGTRILAVADAYDAMTSARPYRAAMSTHDACVELEKQQGRQFDPVIVDALLSQLLVKVSQPNQI